MSYAISVWGANHSSLNPLFMIQKKCLRNLFGIKRISKHIPGHTKNTFNNYKILTIYNLFYYFTFMEIFKLKLYNVPEYLRLILNISLNNVRLTLPKLSLNHYQNNFLHQGPKVWNVITSNYTILETPRPKQVKNKLKHILLLMQSYTSNNLDHEWLPSNNNLEVFINQSKLDPYYKQ